MGNGVVFGKAVEFTKAHSVNHACRMGSAQGTLSGPSDVFRGQSGTRCNRFNLGENIAHAVAFAAECDFTASQYCVVVFSEVAKRRACVSK